MTEKTEDDKGFELIEELVNDLINQDIFSEKNIPTRMIDSLNKYVTKGWAPGSFLTSVLSNDLIGACEHADCHNVKILPAYAKYIYCNIPRNLWGSREIVNKHINSFNEIEKNKGENRDNCN